MSRHRREPSGWSRASLPALATSVLAACAGLPSVGDDRQPAAIIFYGDTATIDAPDTVAVGAPFTVRIRTFGGGCVRRTAGADVVAGQDALEIRPYNLDSGGPICTSDLMFLIHEVELRAAAPGPLVLRVIGTRRDAGSPDASIARLERRMVAR